MGPMFLPRTASVLRFSTQKNHSIESALKHNGIGDRDTIGSHAEAKVEHLRSWLTGRPVPVAASARYPEADFTMEPGGWTRREFIAAVQDPDDRAFLLGFLQLVDANAQQRAQGTHARL